MTLRFDMNTGKRSETGLVAILTQLGGMKAPRGRIGGVLLRNRRPVDIFLTKYHRMHF
jgi:hypothetical protein